MNREIKFRGVADKSNGDIELVYGDLSHDSEDRTAYYDTHPYRICWKNDTAYCNKPIRKNTAMQYIGLKDRNDVEIYEGDLIKNRENIYEVVYSVSGFTVKNIDSITALPASLEWISQFAYDSEVIGNIYENPELYG